MKRAALGLLVLSAACGGSVSGEPGDSDAITDTRNDDEVNADDDEDDDADSLDPTQPALPPDPPSPTTPDPPDLPKVDVHYVGRFTGDGRFQWPGSGVVARFKGTGISINLAGGENWLEVYLDGDPVETLHYTGAATVPLVSGLKATDEHRIEVYRRGESFFGVMTFKGFTVAGGALVPSVDPFSRTIEFIGDSITCGYGNEGVGPGCGFSGPTENETLAWGAVTSRMLGASHTSVAWSGKGMYRDNTGSTSGTMSALYERTLPSEATAWDRTKRPPDVIVINLGTNDWAKGDPGQAYVTAYTAFVKKLRGYYPNAHIFGAMGPQENRSQAHAYVETAIANANDPKAHYLKLAAQGSVGYGCDYHPNVAQHQLMANAAVAAIKSATGW